MSDAAPQIDTPVPGFYKTRLARDGAWVAARIWHHTAERDEAGDLLEDEGVRCEIAGERQNPYEHWPYMCGNPIDESEYKYLMGLHNWAKENSPQDAYANPKKSIDLMNSKPIF